jgi:CRP/FNR family transcriptional regulator, cyclic AMP receptor protein
LMVINSDGNSLPRARAVRLLMVDPELGEDIDPGRIEQARQQIVLPSVALETGSLSIGALREVPGVEGDIFAFHVLSGSLTTKLQMAGRECARVVSNGALVLLDGPVSESIPVNLEWTVLDPARIAIFDQRLFTILRQWPQILAAILRRAAQQPKQALMQQAISQLPRVEDRLLALFWSIADRHGVVRTDGIWVPMSVTHEMLARMVGAQRPTVSLGLARLADAGFLRSERGGWLINPESLELFSNPAAGDEHRDALGQM